ncbi:coiled-coil domain-containing protein 27 isoform X2 [Pogona vitticeps]
MEKPVSLMRKGFNELQEMVSHTQQNPAWHPLSGSKINLSKSSKAVRLYYEKQAEDGVANPTVSGYTPEVEQLQKSFLMRPGCPRFSHRATSTAHLEGNFARTTGLPSNISTISLSSQISLDDWTSILQNADLLEGKTYARYCPVTSTQSLCGLYRRKSRTDSGFPALHRQSHSGSRIPWYIAVLQEKDWSLQQLEEELAHLSRCEAESARKDEVISVLREEVEAMQKQLDQFQRSSFVIPVQTQEEEKSQVELATGEASTSRPRSRVVSLPATLDRRSIPEEFQKELGRMKLELAQKDKTLDSEVGLLNEALLKDQEALEQLEKEYMEIQEKGTLESGEEALPESDSKASKEIFEGETEPEVMEETEEEMIIRKLLEFQRMNNELYKELEKVKNDYDIATGAICSLQRQLSFEGSRLRRAHSEQALLQKELRERGDQLEAMSNKFCNLREERKHEEMMGSIERENYKLRQDVVELEGKLAEKSQLVDQTQSNVNRLQAELAVNQHHIGKQLSRQNELQRQLEVLQRAEQQTRVMLESISARFERFRSKIIQATYSTPGSKSPQAEISDEEVLEALQKIITDRIDFHQMLKQKGVKVPSLSSEPSPSTPHKKKSTSR